MDATAPPPVPVETLIAEVRAALGTAGIVASKEAPSREQLTELGRAVGAGHDALNQIAVLLVGSSSSGFEPPNPG